MCDTTRTRPPARARIHSYIAIIAQRSYAQRRYLDAQAAGRPSVHSRSPAAARPPRVSRIRRRRRAPPARRTAREGPLAGIIPFFL